MSQRLFLPLCLSYSWKHHLQITNSIFNSRVCTKSALFSGKRAHPSGMQTQGFGLTHLQLRILIRSKQNHLKLVCLCKEVNKIQPLYSGAYLLLLSFSLHEGREGKRSSQLSWRVSAAVTVRERCPEPNSTTETPLGATRTVLCQAGTSSARTNRGENKGHNFSFDSAEGINTLFSRELSEAGCLCVSLNS